MIIHWIYKNYSSKRISQTLEDFDTDMKTVITDRNQKIHI